MAYKFIIILLIKITLSTGCATTTDPSSADKCASLHRGSQTLCRPFRMTTHKFSRELDSIKPIAHINSAGWVFVSDLVVGKFDNDWIGAYSQKDKRVSWWFKTEADATTPLATFGQAIFLGLRDGQLIKIDATSGNLLWKSSTGKLVSRPLFIKGSTLLAHNIVDQLFSIDVETGKTKWIYDAGTTNPLAMRGSSPPIIDQNHAFMATSNGDIHLIDLNTGEAKNKVNPHYTDSRFHDFVGDLVLHDQLLITGRNDGTIAAVSLKDFSSVVWKELFPAITTTKYHEEILYAGAINGDIYALDPSSGRRLWSARAGQTISNLTISNKIILAASTQGYITALDSSTGKTLWRDDLGGSVMTPPLLQGNKVFYMTGLNVLYGYQLY